MNQRPQRCAQYPARDVPPLKKPAPGIPGTVLQEPYLVGQQTLNVLEELFRFLIGAVDGDLLGLAVIQAEHAHKAAAVDMVAVRSHNDGEGFSGGQGHKILNFLTGTKPNHEFLHIISPKAVQI
jgi:hypothetical protein